MLIRVADRGATYPLRIDPLIQQGKELTGTGGFGTGRVGYSVAASPRARRGLAQGGTALGDPAMLAIGLGAGLLSSAIPYALELEALRLIPNAVFGVLMSLEPAVAALVGFLALSQDLAAVQLFAIARVVVGAGALHSASWPPPREV